ncbi:MAG: S41 family peptidase [Gammaproteobacteria bacterium]|nr:S41 family peptidase [Gammaproteobacteria bacterium]MDH5304438.1 S41 family peptidase [Gammaproteobacteria bacterium]MDH5322212.1 S41 family peptidase [Gammaproteobacteria bacterium]
MRNSLVMIAGLILAACGSSDGNRGNAGGGLDSCSNNDQKQFVWDAMRDWYLWNNLLPGNILLSDYASPEALLDHLMSYSPDDSNGAPLDRFSFIGSAAADAAFFGEGQYEGFGFSSKQFAADDIRLTQVFADSPADLGGLARGQRILEINGRTVAAIQAAEGIDAVLGTSPLTFVMQQPDGAQLTTTIARDIVTITPVPQYRLIDAGDGSGRLVGYIELASFIGTADDALNAVFAKFVANGINDVILDLRYNGGGLVSTANLLGDLLGGDVAENLLFSATHFNADRAAANDSSNFFDRLAASMSLSRLVVVASDRTASASELVTNSMMPHVEVVIVGDTTFGKPVGQVGFEFCSKILRPTAFQTVNADGYGDYFDGIPVDCPATDELSIAVGADADPNVIAAMAYLDTGACPVVVAPTVSKAQATQQTGLPESRSQRPAPPWREFAGAY